MYRPWGKIDWILSLSSIEKWFFIGTLGTESRSICCWKYLKSLSLLHGERLVKVYDLDCEKYRKQNDEELSKNHNEYLELQGSPENVLNSTIMANLYEIQNIADVSVEKKESIILDVSSMPKRFFFPIIKKYLLDDSVKNLILTYTSPNAYTSDVLYEDIDEWKILPGFGGDEDIDKGATNNLVVSIGFLVESLKSYCSTSHNHGRVHLLIPFPAPLSVVKRTWESISNMERDQDQNRFEKHRVDTLDCCSAFELIKSISKSSKKPLAFAPFGPKPISLAMCFHAIQKKYAVYYPQPTIYHPNYSVGIKNDNPVEAITAYWVKSRGENLYKIT